jgi:hypothetical protein
VWGWLHIILAATPIAATALGLARWRRDGQPMHSLNAGSVPDRRWLTWWGTSLLIGASVAGVPASAPASFATGLSGLEYTSADPSERGHWYDETVAARSELVRINVAWRGVASSRPADPANPADPAYDFTSLDAGVRDAAAHGVEVLLTLYDAPDFAEGPGRAASAPPGTWRPDPAQYASFARAVAARYSGSYLGLPHVRYYQAWNEPGLSNYLTPQWDGKSPAAAQHYRVLLNAFEESVHGVRVDNVVVTAGTAPFGDPPGGNRTRPLRFWREVLCLRKAGGKLKGRSCPEKARFDILAHHPIQTGGGPRQSAGHPDDVTTPDFKNVVKTLRRAEKLNKVPGGRHSVWATEIWWQSNPPDKSDGLPLKRQAAWIEESLYLLWRQGADTVINLFIRDGEFDPAHPAASIEAGLFFHDGSAKPALTAWRFPFVVDPERRGRALAWGKAPAGGKLKIQRKRDEAWRTVERVRAKAGRVFTAPVRAAAGQRFRATVAGEDSLTWRAR